MKWERAVRRRSERAARATSNRRAPASAWIGEKKEELARSASDFKSTRSCERSEQEP